MRQLLRPRRRIGLDDSLQLGPLFGLQEPANGEAECDVVTCFICGKQYNAVTGSKRDLEHTDTLGAFYRQLVATTARSSLEVFLALKQESPKCWRSLFLDELIRRLKAAPSPPAAGAILQLVTDARLQDVCELLAKASGQSLLADINV